MLHGSISSSFRAEVQWLTIRFFNKGFIALNEENPPKVDGLCAVFELRCPFRQFRAQFSTSIAVVCTKQQR